MSERDIFTAALNEAGPAARAAYLDVACGSDAGLRARVERLLRAHDRPDSLLDAPAPAPSGAGDPTRTHAGNGPVADSGLGLLAPPGRPDSFGRIGHYDVLEVLGRGGFGIVFRAFDAVLQRVVAVKVLSPLLAVTSPARKRFLREARSSAAVRHENVVQVHAVEEQPLPYLVMEFIPGETLQARQNRTGPLGVAEVVRVGRQIAAGLAAAHAQGLIHRDVKPANVLTEAGPAVRAKLTDFGLARAADDASLSQSGVVAGTPLYMSPEQARGERVDARTDLFSLGSVLYAMTTGRPPFRAEGTVAILKRVAEDAPRPIREVIPETPEWLCRIVEKLHAKNPADRFQTAREVADLLADCERQLATHANLKDLSRIPAGKLRTSGRSRRWVAAAVVGVGLLIGAVAVGRALRPTERPLRQDALPPSAAAPVPEPDPALPAKTRQQKWAEAFVKYVAALSPEDQVAAVESELKKRNPEFGGKVYSDVERGKVTGLNLLETQGVKDIAPVAALRQLQRLNIPGSVADLGPLRGLPLRKLQCFSGCQVTDLSPLQEMPLEHLLLWQWAGDDMTPLRGMALRELNLGGGGGKVDMAVLKGMPLERLYLMNTDVSDLSALAGMRLNQLSLAFTGVTDLSPVKGMPLEGLTFQKTGVTDLSPLVGMPLKFVSFHDTGITDLSPLKGMPLEELDYRGTKLTDLRPIAGAPLKILRCDFVPARDADVLRGIKTLEKINGQSAAEFWKGVDGK